MKYIIYIFILILCFFVYLRFIEKRSIFFPMKEMESNPSLVNLSFEDIYFKTGDNIELNGWFIPKKDARYTMLFFHGNAGNIGHRLEKCLLFNNLGLNIFIIDYRGYGKSKGSPSEKGLYKDAEAAYRYLVSEKHILPQEIILFGESLGGAVAIDLASKENVRALITEEAFSSVKDMVGIIYPFLPYFILHTRLDSVSKIKDVKMPKLIIHSRDDEIVSFKLGERLFDAAAEPKEFLMIRGGHNTAFLDSQKQYSAGIADFLQQLN